jgi:hypothetical protein
LAIRPRLQLGLGLFQCFRLLHAFSGGTDGVFPYCEPLLDEEGNVYVNTQNGGPNDGDGGVFVYRP